MKEIGKFQFAFPFVLGIVVLFHFALFFGLVYFMEYAPHCPRKRQSNRRLIRGIAHAPLHHHPHHNPASASSQLKLECRKARRGRGQTLGMWSYTPTNYFPIAYVKINVTK